MKLVLPILLLGIIFLFSGCYSIGSLQEKSEELVEVNLSNEEASKDYFNENYYNVEFNSNYELANTDSLEEEEPGFFENLFTEIIAGFSNISNNEDNMMMIFNGDNVIYIVNSDNSSDLTENSSTDLNHRSTRNTGDRYFNSRK